MNKYDRYLKIVAWASKRYRDANGFLVLSHGGKPSKFSRIENLAAVKLMGAYNHFTA